MKMGHHQKQTINNCCSVLIPLLFSNSRVDKANSNGYNHRLIARSAELGVETIDHCPRSYHCFKDPGSFGKSLISRPQLALSTEQARQ